MTNFIGILSLVLSITAVLSSSDLHAARVDECSNIEPTSGTHYLGWVLNAPNLGYYGIDRCRTLSARHHYDCAQWNVNTNFFAYNVDSLDGRAFYNADFTACWGYNLPGPSPATALSVFHTFAGIDLSQPSNVIQSQVYRRWGNPAYIDVDVLNYRSNGGTFAAKATLRSFETKIELWSGGNDFLRSRGISEPRNYVGQSKTAIRRILGNPTRFAAGKAGYYSYIFKHLGRSYRLFFVFTNDDRAFAQEVGRAN